MGALSRRLENPSAASRPFDRGRDGFVLADSYWRRRQVC
ncbi:hypothetical protein [Streptomyces sp. NPDC058657]